MTMPMPMPGVLRRSQIGFQTWWHMSCTTVQWQLLDDADQPVSYGWTCYHGLWSPGPGDRDPVAAKHVMIERGGFETKEAMDKDYHHWWRYDRPAITQDKYGHKQAREIEEANRKAGRPL